MKISAMFTTDISSALHSIGKELPGDLKLDSLTKERIHFASNIRKRNVQRHQKNATDMLRLIRVNHFTEIYPNLDIVLRIYLGLMVTN